MSMASCAVRIHTDEHRVVVLCILVEEMRLCKSRNSIVVYAARLAEVSKYTVHVFVGWRQSK